MNKAKKLALAAVLAAVASAAFAYGEKCSIDGSPLIWNGETVVDFGKLLKVMECLHGHRFLVPM